jgi:hypothetical protein
MHVKIISYISCRIYHVVYIISSVRIRRAKPRLIDQLSCAWISPHPPPILITGLLVEMRNRYVPTRRARAHEVERARGSTSVHLGVWMPVATTMSYLQPRNYNRVADPVTNRITNMFGLDSAWFRYFGFDHCRPT